MNNRRRYPVAKPSLTALEEKYALDAIRSGWVSSRGPYLERFEKEFATRCGVRAALATSNGTVALHLVLAAAGIGPGDEVIVPAMTYIATANAITYCGAKPVFVDVCPRTWCIDVDQVEANIGGRTRAVIAVDLYGHPADYDRLQALCRAKDLLLVADAAESLGARLNGAPTGCLADATTFSFFGNKVVTSGEGGCITTSDEQLADRIRLLRNQGMDDRRRYFFPVVGYNYRLTNVAAALLCAQMERSEVMIMNRRRVIHLYETALADIELLTPQPTARGIIPGPWMASFLVGGPGDTWMRDRLAAELERLGVETRPFFIPIPDLPPYQVHRAGEYRVSRDLGMRGINLPTFDGLADQDVSEIGRRVRLAMNAVSTTAVLS